MDLRIAKLMDIPAEKHDLAWLKDALQSAIALELSTIPPYLCGWLSLPDPASTPARLIKSVVFDEMAHLGLVCNMLRACGVKPDILGAYDTIVYPGPLPGGVRPKCDPKFFPCDPNFQVQLGFTDFQSFAKMCMQIEYPEDPVPPPEFLALKETFPSIGEFYKAIQEAFNNLPSTFPYDTAKQLTEPMVDVFVISGLITATQAIDRIREEGEGSSRYPFTTPGGTELSHFYKFGEIYKGHAYVYDSASRTGFWTGAPLTIPQPYPMTPVPLGGYGAGAPAGVADCDRLFTQMLGQLDNAWDGNPSSLSDAIDSMTSLRSAATTLLKSQIARPGGGIYGPQFRKV